MIFHGPIKLPYQIGNNNSISIFSQPYIYRLYNSIVKRIIDDQKKYL